MTEPFSTAHLWDALTHEAYAAQPCRNGKHYQLTENCSEAEIAEWREWCRKYPKHWPSHVRRFISERKRKGISG